MTIGLSRGLPLFTLAWVVACSGEREGAQPGGAGGSVTDGNASGGTPEVGSSPTSGGGTLGTGGAGAIGTGGDGPTLPVDCTALSAAGYEICESAHDFCGVVFSDGAGCTSVCAAAGLACESAHENVDGACGADQLLAALPCDSGHQSDYCLCRGAASAAGGSAAGGSAAGGSAAGGSAAGGSAAGGSAAAADCNSVGGQPIIQVKMDGSGNFTTVQAALNSLPKSNTTPTQIRIAPGTYIEKLVVDRPNVTLCGQLGQQATTILTYGDGADTSNGNGGTLGTSGSFSTNISANQVSVENLTIQNTRGVGSQAVALLLSGSEVQFRNCRMIGHQDTLYTKSGSQYFKDCYVEGTVDFIFGGATAVFQDCTIHNVIGGTAVTAPNTDQGVPFGLVFLGGELTGASAITAGSMALGRNWGAYGAAAFIETALGPHISAVGWVPMGQNTLATARFSEFETTGSGAKPSQRAADSSQLSSDDAADYSTDNIFGSWTPSFSN